MKLTRHLILVAFIFNGVLAYSQADTSGVTTTTDEGPGGDLLKILPPLSLLVDSALSHSPEMRMAEASLTKSEYTVQEAREDWTELISVSGRYTYGQFLVGEAVGFGLSGPRSGYQMFAGVSLPLSYFTGRSERIGSLRAELKIQEEVRRRTKMDIREEVIETYNQLLLLQKLISITAEARESALLQYQMAEERFREGEITLEELANSTDMRANFASEYEKLRTDFSNVYSRLERLVGTPFSKFPKQ